MIPFEFPKTRQILISEVVDAICAPKLWEIGITGRDIKIAVIDTGSNKNNTMTKHAIIEEKSFVPGEGANDGNGHGSWCISACAGRKTTMRLGTLYGVAPEAKVIAIKVLSDKGYGETSWVMKGIEYAVKRGADILSLSLGSVFGSNFSPSSRLINEITFKHKKLCSIAAGNSFVPFSIASPGAAAGAITVGSVSLTLPQKNAISTFSSKGPSDSGIKPDISVYGGQLIIKGIYESIVGAGPSSSFISVAGTSMATPIIAGSLALLLQAGLESDRLVVEELLALTGQLPFKDIGYGWGVFNVARAYKQLEKAKIPVKTPPLKPIDQLSSIFAAPIIQQKALETKNISLAIILREEV